MSDTYTADGSGGYQSPLTPADGDFDDAASFDPPIARTADNVDYNRRRWEGRYFDVPLTIFATPSRFVEYFAGSDVGLHNNDVTDAGSAFIEVPPLPIGCTLDKVRVTLDGARVGGVGHAGIPGTKPRVLLYEVDSAGQLDSLGGIEDPTTVLATYESLHSFELDGVGHVIADGDRFFVELKGETGTNSLSRTLITKVEIYVAGKVAS